MQTIIKIKKIKNIFYIPLSEGKYRNSSNNNSVETEVMDKEDTIILTDTKLSVFKCSLIYVHSARL